MRFSIQIPVASGRDAWLEKVKRAEDLGFFSVSVPDHLGPSLPQLAPMVALAVAAAATDRIRLAVTVLNNDFRHPVMVARESATLDLLSTGRLDLGLGAGWLEEDYTKSGIAPWDQPGVRVDRLAESITLLRRLLSGDTVEFAGRFYEVHDYRSFPTPVQAPLPLIIGGRGRRVLSLGAREAQIVSILGGVGDGSTRAGLEKQLGWIEQAGGRGRPDLTVGLRVPFGQVASAAESGRAAAEALAARLGRPLEDVVDSPFMVVGDAAMVKDHLAEIGERYDIGYITVSEDLGWDIAPVVAALSD